MTPGIKTFVSDIFVGSNRAYIYLWVSKSYKFVYVGQTNEKYGTWGRGYSHVQLEGTLRCRCEDKLGIYLDGVNDLTLYSYLLPKTAEYLSVESSFRLAVEYLVQMKIHEIKNTLTPKLYVVSNVTTTDRTNDKMVKELSVSIVNDFIESYSQE